jgi:hypothetical protein
LEPHEATRRRGEPQCQACHDSLIWRRSTTHSWKPEPRRPTEADHLERCATTRQAALLHTLQLLVSLAIDHRSGLRP